MKSYNYSHLFLLLLFILSGCAKEVPLSPIASIATQEISTEPYIDYSNEVSCIPVQSIELDTTVQWLLGEFGNPYQGRQEHGWGRAELVPFNYEWNASAKAFDRGNKIVVGLETFKSEEIYYYFIELFTFEILKDAERCVPLYERIVTSTPALTSSAQYHIGSGDVIHYSYNPDENYPNTLEVLELDTINKRIVCKFNVKMINERPSIFPENPDTIRFVNGRFECDIIN